MFIKKVEVLRMFADYHVHTAFSDDSIYPMEQVVQDAISKKIDEICFAEHVDYGIKVDWDSGKEIVYRNGEPCANCNYPLYMKTIKQMKKRYGNKITIKTGLEFGMQMHTIKLYEKLFSQYDLDFVLLSIHQVNDLEFWNQDYQRGKTQKEYNEGYYDEMLQLVKSYKNYSVLWHMDLINRYDLAGIYPFEKIKPFIEKILKVVIQDKKGIEINTSSKRYGLKDTTPSLEILKLYHQLGGEIITIGSDSHKPEHLTAYIQEGKELLRLIGFTQYCTFEKMKPIFHSL